MIQDRTIQALRPNDKSNHKTMSLLLFGYGNIDRQDDGVAWHILRSVSGSFNFTLPEFPEDSTYQINPDITCTFHLQLSPEDAEQVSEFDQVFFIDAHTGNVEGDLNFTSINPQFQSSPFTHHLTPQTCLSLAMSLYGRTPAAFLVSVRGYEFGFSRELSALTQKLSVQASLLIIEKINTPSDK